MARNLIKGDALIRALRKGDCSAVIWDGDGLSLRTFVKGGDKHGWRFRFQWGGRPQEMSLGVYPDVGLAEARRKAQEARSQVVSVR